MSTHDRMTAGSAEKRVGEEAVQEGVRETLGRLDDAQVIELMSDAYWTLLERFISLDGEGTSVSSVASVS